MGALSSPPALPGSSPVLSCCSPTQLEVERGKSRRKEKDRESRDGRQKGKELCTVHPSSVLLTNPCLHIISFLVHIIHFLLPLLSIEANNHLLYYAATLSFLLPSSCVCFSVFPLFSPLPLLFSTSFGAISCSSRVISALELSTFLCSSFRSASSWRDNRQ